ncbi:MAG: O-antigen ligase family protein [Desulfuromonadaceae bacterium]|nr:O-antigen ligase family protein [Desulfuromonadaceae bacterium]MDD2854365.1 O-antigen ligase family protein [Desulfuromonadaceae bacterium]
MSEIFKPSVSIEKALLNILAVGFGIPFALFDYIPISLLDVDMFMVFFIIFILGRSKLPHNIVLLIIPIIISLSCIAVELAIGDSSYRPFMSVGYFFKPYLAYVVGYSIIVNICELRKMIHKILLILIVVLCSAAILGNATFRGDLAILGLSVFGSSGTNALMVYLAFLLMLSASLLDSSQNRLHKIFFAVLFLIVIGIIIESSSRQALLGIIIFCLLSLKNYKNNIIIFALLAVFIFTFINVNPPRALVAKLNRDKTAISEVDADSFSAGRTLIYYSMVKDIIQNPWLGNSFKGFSESNIPVEFEYSSGLSPHNQYLGALWKMGAVAFVFYIAFLFTSVLQLWKMHRNNITEYRNLAYTTAVVLLLFMNTQDFLTFGLTGNLFMLVLGGLRRINREKLKLVEV